MVVTLCECLASPLMPIKLMKLSTSLYRNASGFTSATRRNGMITSTVRYSIQQFCHTSQRLRWCSYHRTYAMRQGSQEMGFPFLRNIVVQDCGFLVYQAQITRTSAEVDDVVGIDGGRYLIPITAFRNVGIGNLS